MKKLLLLLLVFLLLTGCGKEKKTETEPVTVPEETTLPPVETEAPTTEPEPVDPMEALLAAMTIEEKVGQMFLARCPSGADAADDAARYHLGGYILFGRDFAGQTPETLRRTIDFYQAAAKIPMLIAVDEEGGTVCRVSAEPAFRSEKFYSPAELYQFGGMDAILTVEAEKSALLSGLGINVNMAPVVDISPLKGSFMYHRSLRESPEVTGEFAAKVSRTMAEYGVGSVLKHFPGYGSNVDTHTGIARDSRSLEELEACDLIPFGMGIESGCGAILVSHNIIEALDAEFPATLSSAVHHYLRDTMGFDGVVVTDDLAMGAITEAYGAEEAAILAVEAGNDLLCVTDYRLQYAAVLGAVLSGRIPEETIDRAAGHILRWKQDIGILNLPER